MTRQPTDFAYHLSRYLGQVLPARHGASPLTIRSYRDTFTLWLQFCDTVEGLPPERLALAHVTVDRVDAFLRWLEETRQSSVATRNQRMAALHAFARYLETVVPERLHQWQQILAMPRKRQPQAVMHYLTLDGLRAILDGPNRATRAGRRDLVLLSVLYDTGARVQELADLRAQDVRLAPPATIQLTGKGRKSRIVPLMTATTTLLAQYVAEWDLEDPAHGPHPLFPNRSGAHLTRAGITFIVKKYSAQARAHHPEGIPAVVSPHVFRHSKAMHLLQVGVNLVYIRDLLGHVSVTTTEVYARADSEMKRRALEAAYPHQASVALPPWQANTDLLAWLKSLGR
jgi:site-specific recombinase XerD